jgi:capsular exopolysaccharide synthesis family protein
MTQPQNVNNQEEIDIRKVVGVISANYKPILICLLLALAIAALVNHYLTPLYQISSSIMIKEDNKQIQRPDVNNYLNSSLITNNQSFQNELWILKSSPVLENTIRNLDLQVSYYSKEGFRYIDAYKTVPFQIFILHNHIQPVGVRFYITFQGNDNYYLRAEAKKASFHDFISDQPAGIKRNWIFEKTGKFGEPIETSDMAFIIQLDTVHKPFSREALWYGFEFTDINSLKESFKKRLQFNIIDKLATVVEIRLKSESVKKGIDVVNELMNVYSSQNLDRKNHIATITIDYIERQLNEISDSLNQTEDNLQRFRSSNQLLNINDQATGISAQYMTLQNQLAELVTRKRYYDYVADYLAKNDNFSNMIVPASLGIQDQLLSNLMAELIADQAQRSNLIENNQEKNPLVQKLEIQIENIKKTISDNISEVSRTTDIAIDEMNKRIERTKGEISRLPVTQRKLGSIERKYRLNDAIYNYLLEKRAEAKITQASNLPDNIIIEPAKMVGLKPVLPNKGINYLLAFFVGLFFPIGYILIKNVFKGKIGDQEDIERLASEPMIGKIPHNRFRTREIMVDFPMSGISESFRTLRTNLDLYVREEQKKVIMITSCLEGEGKTFVALNLALSYAQLGRNTVLVDFDLRKQKEIFDKDDELRLGLSSFLSNSVNLDNIIYKSHHQNLDYIVSGEIPPNPVELIASEKTRELFDRLRDKYDIIILDSPPIANVTDANILLQYANIKIMLIRQNLTRKKIFSVIIKNLNFKNTRDLFLVMNDNRIFNDQYGYGYGYNQKSEKKRNKRT